MIISIEGQIGVGKTTLGQILSSQLNLPFYTELQSDLTIYLLSKFYEDKKRWAFTLQINFLTERFKTLKKVSKEKKGILDRSLYSDQVFCKVLTEEGIISKTEYSVYEELLLSMLDNVASPNLMIYLDCSLPEAFKRIKKRNRDYERKLNEDYLEALNHKYLNWYDSYNLSPKVKFAYESVNIFNQDERLNFIQMIKNKIVM